MKQYQAVVIGAGPGGYKAALELAKSGVQTLLVEKKKEHIGGTCLNEGCIPTKNYLEVAEYASKASFFENSGLEVEVKGLNLSTLQEKTAKLLHEIRSGISWLLDQEKVTCLYGTASFVDAHTIEVDGEQIAFEHCIIATGSQVQELPMLQLDGKKIVSSDEIFTLEALPKSLAIVGGGAIGCEFATFFSANGIKVTLIELAEQLLPSEDAEVAKALTREFKKRNIDVLTSTSVKSASVLEDGIRVQLQGKSETEIECDIVLCATGRTPYTKGLHLKKADVTLDQRGYIQVDETFQSSQKHIYAVGDVIATPGFAHTAYAEAKIAAHNIVHQNRLFNTHITPSVIFSSPAVASCGLNEKRAKETGCSIEVKKALYKTNAKAKIHGNDSGFIKVILCSQSNEILGASIIGNFSTEIIHELLLAVEQKVTLKTLTSTIHAHPTVSEIITFL